MAGAARAAAAVLAFALLAGAAAAAAVRTVGGDPPDGRPRDRVPVPAARSAGEPRFGVVTRVRTWSRDPDRPAPPRRRAVELDVHRPLSGAEGLARGPFPLVVLLRAPGVDGTQHGLVARTVASYGFVVAVPRRRPGPAAVAVARDWARGRRGVAPGPPRVLAVAPRPVLLRDVRAAGLGLVSPVGGRVGAPRHGSLVVVAGGAVTTPARPALVVRVPGLNRLDVTDAGRTGPVRDDLVVEPRRADRVEALGRWFGAWWAAELGDPPSRAFVQEQARSGAADGSVLLLGRPP